MGARVAAAVSAGLVLGLASSATAADLYVAPAPYAAPAPVFTPALLSAVSTVNGKIELAGGYEWGDKFRDHALGRLSGAVSFPIGQQFGAQFDATGIYSRGDYAGSVAAHGFWRDPNVALAGVYAEGYTGDVPRGRLNYGRIGGEGELYLDRIRLSGIAGVEYGDRISTRLFVDALASFYVMDDLRLYAGYRNSYAGSQGRAGVEYQLPPHTGWGNVALFAEGRVGQHGYAAGLGGVRVYFGPQKSLWRRHREDDPEIWSNGNYADASQAVSGGRFARPDKKKHCERPPVDKAQGGGNGNGCEKPPPP